LRLASIRIVYQPDSLAVAWLERGESSLNPNQACPPRSPSIDTHRTTPQRIRSFRCCKSTCSTSNAGRPETNSVPLSPSGSSEPTTAAANNDDALINLVVENDIKSLAAFTINAAHDLGAGRRLAKSGQDIATSLFELPASDSEPRAVLPPTDETLRGVVEANPDVVLVEAYCKDTAERLRSARCCPQP